MVLDTLTDGSLASPGNHGIQEPIATAFCQILISKTKAFPVIAIVRQRQVKRNYLSRDLSCFTGVSNEQHLLLDAEPFVGTDYCPCPRCMLWSNVIREHPIRPSATQGRHLGA